MERQPQIKLSVMECYSLWAKNYDTTWNTLIATEELYSLALLDSLEGESGTSLGPQDESVSGPDGADSR